MLRSIYIVLIIWLVLAFRPHYALAQGWVGVPSRAIQTADPGYCFTDLNSNSSIELSEINITLGTPEMTDALIPDRDEGFTGGRSIIPSPIHIFDNWEHINSQGNYEIDISGVCVGGVSRVDNVLGDFDDDGDGLTDRSGVTDNLIESSPLQNYFDDDGFSFVGGTVTDDQIINFNGQVSGNIAAQVGQSNIIFTLNDSVEVDGLLNLGGANAINDAVLNLAGQIDEIDLDGASDLTVTSSATVGDSDDSTAGYVSATIGTMGLAGVSDSSFTLSGTIDIIDLAGADNITMSNSASVSEFDATGISEGVFLTNTGDVGSIDLSGTAYLDLDLNTGSIIGTLITNNSTSPSSLIDNVGAIERLEIGNSSAAEKVEMAVVNGGTISALTSSAFVIEDTNAAGGEIDVDISNSGSITAATSQAIDFSALDGGRLDFNNSGSVSTNASGNNNAIYGEGAKGLVFLENSGTISSNANHAVNLRSLEGFFRLVNSGSINTNQKAIDLTSLSGSTASVIEIHNGYVVNASGNIVTTNSGSREIKATGQNAVLLDGVSGNISLANAAGASIIAEDSLAIAASGVTGNISLTNAGNIRAHRVAPGLSNDQAIALTGTTGDISFTSTTGLIDARDRTINLETVSGKINFSNGGVISSIQEINDADATATDNYAVRLHRSGTIDDEGSVTNSGTISSTSDHGLLIDGLACDADAATDDYCLTNSGTISAGRQYAIAGSTISDLKFTNSGTVSAIDQTINFADVSGDVVIANSGQITASQEFSGLFPDPDSDKYGLRLVKEAGEDTTIAFTNASGGTISTNADNALVLAGFNGVNDNVTFSNEGTISATEDNAVDLSNSNFSTLSNSGSITAGGNYALLLDGFSSASMVISNLGSITAGTTQPGNAPAAIHGALAASVDTISITAGASSTISSVGNALANGDANSGGAIFLDADSASFTLNNSGSISVGTEATSTAAAVEGNNAIRVTDIGDNAVSLTNASTGTIKAVGDGAIYLKGDSADITSITLDNSGTITADNAVLLFEDAVGATTSITNSGTMTATDSAADHLINLTNVSADFSLANSGVIESAGSRAVYVDMNNASLVSNDMVVFHNQSGGRIDADSETVTLLDINEQVNFDNNGTIRAINGASAVSFSAIGNHQVDFNNNVGGTISASGNGAVSLSGFEALLNLINANTATISAANETVVLVPSTNNARLNFANSGTISASSSSANHVLRFTGFGGELAIENAATGTISSNGSNAIYADHQLETPSLDFDNLGNISARSGDALILSGFTDAVNVVNSGTIEVTAGNTAFSTWGGNETVFSNSGRIEASGTHAVRFSNFVVDAGTPAPQFTNTATGIIRAASDAFETDIGAATGQIYTLNNAGLIIADNGAHAVNMSGAKAAIANSGIISATASPAILAGASSVISISGSVLAGGANPVAIALEGRGSTVNLSDGAIIAGTIVPLDTATNYTDEQKHRVNVSGVNNASYYYEFPTDQFRFFLNEVEKTDGSGFSPATTNLQAVPLIHAHHAQGTRNIWRRLGRFNDKGGFRSFTFADELENERRTDREFTLEGDRSGFVQTFQQSIFGWFEAELILTAQESSFELDNNTFTFDKSYQGVGLGFNDLLAFGPFSFSAMALTGIGQNDMSRLVLSNTVSSGRFNLESSFDTIYLDAAFEALFDMRIWGKKGRLTRRNPYRINLELGLGGSLHDENNDGYNEQTYISAAESDLQSTSVGGRLKFEYERYNPYSRKNIRGFLELEHSVFDTGSGLDFSYSVEGAAQLASIDMAAVALSSIALGVDYEVNDDITANFSLKSVTGDDDSDGNSVALALKWRF